MTRPDLALALGVAAAACGHGRSPATSPESIGHRPEAGTGSAEPPRPRCPAGGVTVEIDLDGDGRDDRVRVVAALDAATCLEIRATTAPPLVCHAHGDAIIPLELDADGVAEESEPITCDPGGASVTIVRRDAPPPVTNPARIETGRTFLGVLVGAAAPSGTGLWLDGGDAQAAIVWRGGWRWYVVGA